MEILGDTAAFSEGAGVDVSEVKGVEDLENQLAGEVEVESRI